MQHSATEIGREGASSSSSLPPANPSSIPDGPKSETSLEALRLLIAEDEAITGMTLEAILDDLGHKVVDVVDNAGAAVAAAARHRPDLVLMDIRLAQGSDGVAAAVDIRRHLGIPSLFVTAHSDQVTADRMRLARPLGLIVKPFSAIQIERALAEARKKLCS